MATPNNNPVIGQTVVYLVFWGPLWGQHWADSTMSAMQQFVQGLAGSNFQTIMNQYYSSNHVIAWNSAALGGAWIDNVAPTTIDYQSIANEAARAQSSNGWGIGYQYQYIIVPQTESAAIYNIGGNCGIHEWWTSDQYPVYPNNTYNASLIGWAPDLGAGCTSYGGTAGTVGAETFVESHEYAESLTDPLLNAWRSNDAKAHEIGDLCTGYTGSYAVGGQWVTQLWSNLAVGGSSGCTTYIDRTFNFSYVGAAFTTGQTLANGHGYSVYLQVQNTGNVPWQVGEGWGVHLGTYNPNNRCSGFADGTWSSCNRIGIASNVSVGGSFPIRPGDVAQFNWAFDPGPSLAPGSYFEEFNLVAEQVGYFSCAGSCLNWTLSVGSYAGCYLSQTDPKPAGGIFIPGDTYTASVTYNNCGSNEWWPYEVVKLGTSHPLGRVSAFSDSTWWSDSIRPDIVRLYTGPGNNYTFTFDLHIGCKQASGTSTEYFQPLAENVTWFTDYGYHVTLNVGKVPDALKCLPIP